MSQQNLRIKNPSLTLYAFHLRTEVNSAVVADAAQLWERVAQLGEHFSMPALQQFSDKLLCYKNGRYDPAGEQGQPTHFLELIQSEERALSFSSVLRETLTLGASIYPLRLHDVYAVDLTFFYENQTIEVKQLHNFNPEGCLMPSHIQASLGQTLLLYAKPMKEDMADKALAEACVNALLQDTNQPCPPLSSQGQLFGSPIFEYEAIPTSDSQAPNELIHILVWLEKHPDTARLAAQANPWLINVFNCRHKIQFAYHQAQQSNQLARQHYNKLENKSDVLSQLPKAQEKRLKSLEEVLNQISHDTFEYARHIRDLADHRTTIETNTLNYAKWLTKLRELSQPMPDDKLAGLAYFHDNICHHHRQQLGTYLDYLKPAHQLFNQMTATVLGMVHIGEQKQQMIREQKFQFLMTFIGAAVGAGAISAAVVQNPPHLVDLVSQWFQLAQLPVIEMPPIVHHFPTFSEDVLKVMFHVMVGGMAALVLSPLISLMSKIFTRK